MRTLKEVVEIGRASIRREQTLDTVGMGRSEGGRIEGVCRIMSYFEIYLQLENIVGLIENEEIVEKLREAMDHVWLELTVEDRDKLDRRQHG
jgi:hypothetical protein